ncbi:MAG: nicotinamide-nucleotide amidohydrolase family protein, partial [Clostridia bacterium]
GLVTYSNEAKSARLNINPHLIDQFGAVSSEVAYEMSVGLLQSHTDFAICTTGYAGPASSQVEEVGLCYISVGTKQSINVYKYKFCGNREQIRKISTNTALFLLVKLIKDKKF